MVTSKKKMPFSTVIFLSYCHTALSISCQTVVKRNLHLYQTCGIFQSIVPFRPWPRTSLLCQRHAAGMGTAKWRLHSDATHSITPLCSHQFKCLQPEKEWLNFFQRATAFEKKPYKWNPMSLIYMYIYVFMHVYVFVCNAVWDVVPMADRWQVVAVRASILLSGERKLPAFSAVHKDHPWKRLRSIRIVNLIISESLNCVMNEQALQTHFSFSWNSNHTGTTEIAQIYFLMCNIWLWEGTKKKTSFASDAQALYTFLLEVTITEADYFKKTWVPGTVW